LSIKNDNKTIYTQINNYTDEIQFLLNIQEILLFISIYRLNTNTQLVNHILLHWARPVYHKFFIFKINYLYIPKNMH